MTMKHKRRTVMSRRLVRRRDSLALAPDVCRCWEHRFPDVACIKQLQFVLGFRLPKAENYWIELATSQWRKDPGAEVIIIRRYERSRLATFTGQERLRWSDGLEGGGRVLWGRSAKRACDALGIREGDATTAYIRVWYQ